ncbi:MAG: hypothetical protein RJA19_531 [Bacteroidota bacterium]
MPTPSSPELLPTGDGSWTLRSGVHGVPYHSVYGAYTESLYVFVEQGLSAWWTAASASDGGRRGCDVLEVGWGSGLNAACAWRWAQDQGVEVRYRALEPDPLPREVLERLDHGERTGMGGEAFGEMMGVPEGQEWRGGAHFSLRWEPTDVRDWEPEAAGSVDVIFFDAFAPESQPELWTEAVFARLYRALRVGGRLVTYCAKGEVRRAMVAAGFAVERLPGPPGKREMLAACKTPPTRFNLRVYGLVVDQGRVLISRERIQGQWYAKFPGGGVEPGEGIRDALHREFREELGPEVEIGRVEHFYTTDFFQRSAFRAEDQVVSIYYRVELASPLPEEGMKAWDGSPLTFHWWTVGGEEGDLAFPIDRHVARMLREGLQ